MRAKHQHGAQVRRVTLARLNPLAAAISSLLAVSGVSHAQQVAPATNANIETLVVTGIRHSIETSVQAKRDSDSIVEVVSAEEIGKLPDVSIAESIARLPGLAAQRVDGRAQVISIRGMAPKYGVTLLNGREMVSTSDNRAVEYDQFPSELVNRVMVYKTPDAALSAQGISGTVNMQSIRPLDYRERKVNLSVRAEKAGNGKLNADSDDFAGRYSVSYVDQFANNTIGLALGFAHMSNPGQEKYLKNWTYHANGGPAPWGGSLPTIAGVPVGALVTDGFEVGVTSSSRKRDGLMAVLEFKPNKDFRSMVDMYYTKFDQTSKQRELQAYTGLWSGVSYANAVVNNGIATGGTISGVTPIGVNRYNDRADDIFAVGWNNELKRDKWTFVADLGYSKAKRKEYNGELTTQLSGPASLALGLNTGGSDFSQYAFANPGALTNPATMMLTQVWGSWHPARGGRAMLPDVNDEMKSFKLSAKRDFDGALSSVEGGVNYSNRTKDTLRGEVWYCLPGAATCPGNTTAMQIPSGMLRSPTNLSFAGIPGVVAFDYNDALGQLYTSGPSVYQWDQQKRSWGVKEKLLTWYGKANFDIYGHVPIRGNFGVQVVQSEQQSKGMLWNGGTNTLTAITYPSKTRTDTLPSLNMVFDLVNVVNKGTQIRLGIAEEMMRPNMEDMRGGFDVRQGVLPPFAWSGSGGNPNLDPWRAFATDLSFEKYFGKRSYVGLAFFDKKLKSFVYNQTIPFDFSSFPTANPTQTLGTLTAPANGKGGKVAGTELSAAIEGGLLHPSLDGFGIVGSLSKTSSNLHEANNVTNSLDGLSGTVSNLVFYYEKNGFSARIGQRYRSAYQSTTRDQYGDLTLTRIGSEKLVDFQLGYAIEHGPYRGLSFVFQINNLTDAPYTTSKTPEWTTGTQLFNEQYKTYGRQYLFGLNYKL